MGNTPTKEIRSSSFTKDLSVTSVNKKKKDRFKKKEEQLLNLIVRYEENVDGGYLAPFGNHNYNLNYKTQMVKDLIVERKLSPFYTPLEEFNDTWSDAELLKCLRTLDLHAKISIEDFENLEEEEEEDPDDHKIYQSLNSIKRKENKLFKKNLKKKLITIQNEENSRFQKDKRIQQNGIKVFSNLPSDELLLTLYRNAEECPICFLYFPTNLNVSRCCDQPICTECFVQLKRLEPHPPHDENTAPGITIDQSNLKITEGIEKTAVSVAQQQDLISEPVKCPFCAVSDFGVTYKPLGFRTGLGGIMPSEFKKSERLTTTNEHIYDHNDINNGDFNGEANGATEIHGNSSSSNNYNNNNNNKLMTATRKRRDSLLPNAPGVITVDHIRPDWEQKLLSARAKLARRSAAATALHASSLIIAGNNSAYDDDFDGDSGSVMSSVHHGLGHHHMFGGTNGGGQGRKYSSGSMNTKTRSSTNASRSRKEQLSIEDRMIEEALRLSLIDEDERKLKERNKLKK